MQFVKEEIDDIRDSLDRLEAEGERRKAKLADQGLTFCLGYSIFAAVLGMLQFGYNTGVINAPESVKKSGSISRTRLNQGCFLPVFKKLKAGSKKTQADFWQKTEGYGGNFGYQEKNSKFFDKNLQNSSSAAL